MPQLHFYVSKDVAEKIRHEAQAANMSISRYLASLIEREVASEWPENFFEEVVGGWVGEPLTRPPQGEFEHRVALEPKKA